MHVYFVYYLLGIIMIPGIILGIVAQSKVSSTFNKYNKIESQRGRPAKDVARSVLNGGDCLETKIQEIPGHLTDNYNPQIDTVSLSKSTYNNNSIAAIGVACHEVGHVFQHKQKYVPVKIRQSLVPVLNCFNQIVWPLLIVGLIIEAFSPMGQWLIYLSLGIYVLETVFCLVTLPVELNASKRAYKILLSTHELTEEEAKGAKKVLNAAALTYVAALITSVLSLLRVLFLIFAYRKND